MEIRRLGRTGLHVSAIGLGTAELGFAYGLGPRTVPTDEEADSFLKRAVELGITYFDTAALYGIAEERIGKSGIARKEGVVIGTKCAQFLEKGRDMPRPELERSIRGEVEESLRKLQIDALPLLMLHGGSKELIDRGELIEIMEFLKEEGKVRFTGISTRGEDAPLAAIRSGFFDVIQTAYSILDQRMCKDVLPLARTSDIGIVNRSVLLKGALTSTADHLPESLAALKRGSKSAAEIAGRLGMNLPTLAVRFALSNAAISTVLIGTNREDHLLAAVEAAEAGPLEEGIVKELEALAIDDADQVDPARWPPLQ
jgi:aryl-alcohol dehydrogenase-like predicted oxidoreductase